MLYLQAWAMYGDANLWSFQIWRSVIPSPPTLLPDNSFKSLPPPLPPHSKWHSPFRENVSVSVGGI